MKTVCIIYGWAEGPAHGKKLRQALKSAHYKITKNDQEADILIAHSGGCFMLPDNSKASLVMLVGLPYWPGRHPLKSLPVKVRQELRNLSWTKKTVFNSYYFFSRPKRSFKMWRAWKADKLPNHEEALVLMIRNSEDTFLHPTDADSLANQKNWQLKALPGQHDDIWNNPQPYIEEINKVIKV